MKWLKQKWAFLALGLIVVAAIRLFGAFWADTNRLAALGSLFGFIVTALLVGITIEYVRTNESTLRLLKEQWKAQNEVEVKFGVRAHDDVAQVWVLNYGLPNVVVTKLLIEMPKKKTHSLYKNAVIRSGEKRRFDLPHREWEKLDLQQNIQVTLFCESTQQQFEHTKVYTLFLTEAGKVYKVRKGLRGLWPVGCPKCKKFMGICMATDGLKNFDEAKQRQEEMEAEVAASCPEHSTKWMLTMKNVTTAETEDDADMS
jgi:hypothetical protein